MAQNTINPFDNPRVKNRKVETMLRELEAWPARPGERPNFIRNERSAIGLIDRALANVAGLDEPELLARSHNPRAFARAANQNFAAAYEAVGGGGGDFPAAESTTDLDFVNGQYYTNGGSVAATAVISSTAEIVNGSGWHMTNASAVPTIEGGAKTDLLLSSGKIVIEWQWDGGNEFSGAASNADQSSTLWGISLATGQKVVYRFVDPTEHDSFIVVSLNAATPNKLAFSYSDTTLAAAINGVLGDNLSFASLVASPTAARVAGTAAGQIQTGHDGYIRRITRYPLSATPTLAQLSAA